MSYYINHVKYSLDIHIARRIDKREQHYCKTTGQEIRMAGGTLEAACFVADPEVWGHPGYAVGGPVRRRDSCSYDGRARGATMDRLLLWMDARRLRRMRRRVEGIGTGPTRTGENRAGEPRRDSRTTMTSL
jgi:hypothetical protein